MDKEIKHLQTLTLYLWQRLVGLGKAYEELRIKMSNGLVSQVPSSGAIAVATVDEAKKPPLALPDEDIIAAANSSPEIPPAEIIRLIAETTGMKLGGVAGVPVIIPPNAAAPTTTLNAAAAASETGPKRAKGTAKLNGYKQLTNYVKHCFNKYYEEIKTKFPKLLAELEKTEGFATKSDDDKMELRGSAMAQQLKATPPAEYAELFARINADFNAQKPKEAPAAAAAATTAPS